MPTLELLELLELVLLAWLVAACKVMALSATIRALLPAVMAEPWTRTFEFVPPPVAMMLTLLPADTVLPLAVSAVLAELLWLRLEPKLTLMVMSAAAMGLAVALVKAL